MHRPKPGAGYRPGSRTTYRRYIDRLARYLREYHSCNCRHDGTFRAKQAYATTNQPYRMTSSRHSSSNPRAPHRDILQTQFRTIQVAIEHNTGAQCSWVRCWAGYSYLFLYHQQLFSVAQTTRVRHQFDIRNMPAGRLLPAANQPPKRHPLDPDPQSTAVARSRNGLVTSGPRGTSLPRPLYVVLALGRALTAAANPSQ